MSIAVISAGPQTTLQAAPFSGFRHIGMPSAGAADSLSFILANRLIGKGTEEAAIEITLGAAKFRANSPCVIAVSGAARFLHINDTAASMHGTQTVRAGDEIHIGPAKSGCRSYLAINRPLESESAMNGCSTYLAAKMGGFNGRALQNGDVLDFAGAQIAIPDAKTPAQLIPVNTDSFLLRTTKGPEFSDLRESSQKSLFTDIHLVGRRSNRMGIALPDRVLAISGGRNMNSAAVFPGTIQCPPDGKPFLLGPDAQTTGGYPRIAQVIRADRHLIGQMRPGSKVQFVNITAQQATEIYRKKLALLTSWIEITGLW